jgi:hypothetical protein
MIPVKNATILELHLQNKGASKIAVEVIRSVFQNMMQEYHGVALLGVWDEYLRHAVGHAMQIHGQEKKENLRQRAKGANENNKHN